MNRLGSATSPYLLQHADNPVDWHEWGSEAFAEAKRRDVPLLISVGYSACHWCHVMAHESFEDERTAALMNENFVCVKVDREERPDVDAVYMAATQAMTGQGGWPMTVFASHDGKPFYCGTYFPKVGRGGLPSFTQLLDGVGDAWRERREEVEQVGSQVAVELARTAQPLGEKDGAGADALDDTLLAEAVDVLARDFDPVHAGFGGAPKFPPSMTLIHLLRHHRRISEQGQQGQQGQQDQPGQQALRGLQILQPKQPMQPQEPKNTHQALDLASRTFEAMARGGIYDQLAGGFARYAVDATWTVPHFEKMLYDNALLLRAYTLWWKEDGSPLARRIAEETAQFLLRGLRTREGGFASALDADTEGVEGLTYAWTPAQLRDVLGDEDGPWAAELFAVTERGTFEHGTSVLELHTDPDDPARYERIRGLLAAARSTRPQPGIDDKVVAAWNGLAITALVEASLAFDDPTLLAAATAAADLLARIHLTDGRLVRTSRNGQTSTNPGVLEDYGCVAEAFTVLYSANGERRWLDLAGQLLETVRAQFRTVSEPAPTSGTDSAGTTISWHDTAADADALYFRPSDPTDNATPSGVSAAAAAFAAYALAAGSLEHLDDAYAALIPTARLANRAPRFVGYGLAVAEALAAEIPKAFVCPGPFC